MNSLVNSRILRLPLLKDNHTHVSFYSALLGSPNLAEIDTKEEALKTMKSLDDEINVVLGWNEARYSFSQQELADLPSTVICNVSLHSFIINPPAKEIIGDINKEMVDKVEDQSWVERHLAQIFRVIVGLKEWNEEKIDLHFQSLEKSGIWYAEDMLASDVRTIKYLVNKYRNRTALWTDLDTYRALPRELQEAIRGIKVFTDGAIGAFSAALDGNYLSRGNGLLLFSDEELLDKISLIADMKKPVSIHAIGDRALRQTTNILEQVRRCGMGLPIRIEHCQFGSSHESVGEPVEPQTQGAFMTTARRHPTGTGLLRRCRRRRAPGKMRVTRCHRGAFGVSEHSSPHTSAT